MGRTAQRTCHDRAALTKLAQQFTGEKGSNDWYLAHANRGDQLFSLGRRAEAEAVFRELLEVLTKDPSDQRCETLYRLGQCLSYQGKAVEAKQCLRQGLAEAEKLEATEWVNTATGNMQTELANALRNQGDYAGAKAAYEAALGTFEELGDRRNAAVVKGQLGSLAYKQGNLPEAEKRYWEAVNAFQQLNEPAQEAVFWHNLGMVYKDAKQLEAAEQAYREAARIDSDLENYSEAAIT